MSTSTGSRVGQDDLVWRDDWREAGGVRTFALVTGSGRPPVVLVPGLGGSHRYFRRLQRELAPAHQSWAYDPPGYGRTRAPLPAYESIASQTDHLAAWIGAAGLAGAAVLGYSNGAEIAIDLAARYPQLPSALVLTGPTGVPQRPSVLVQALNLMRDTPRERPAYVGRVILSFLRAGPVRSLRLAHDQHHHDTVARLALVRVPTLVVRGELDPVVSRPAARALCAGIGGAQYMELARAAHAVHDRRAPEVASAVSEFLARARDEAALVPAGGS